MYFIIMATIVGLRAGKCVVLFKFFFFTISTQGTLERLCCVLLVFWGCNCDCKTILKNRLLWVWWLKQSDVLLSSFYNRAPLLAVCSEASNPQQVCTSLCNCSTGRTLPPPSRPLPPEINSWHSIYCCKFSTWRATDGSGGGMALFGLGSILSVA